MTMVCSTAAIRVNLKVEQSINLKFLLKLKKTPTECDEMYKVFGGKGEPFFGRQKWFSEGKEKVKDDELPNRPVTARTERKFHNIIEIVRK